MTALYALHALYETYHMTSARGEAWCMSVAESVLEAAPAVRWGHMIPATCTIHATA